MDLPLHGVPGPHTPGMSELQVNPEHLKYCRGLQVIPEAQSRCIDLAGWGNTYLVLNCPALAHRYNPISILVLAEANLVTSSPDASAYFAFVVLDWSLLRSRRSQSSPGNYPTNLNLRGRCLAGPELSNPVGTNAFYQPARVVPFRPSVRYM